jgi:hypothetical protein
MMGLLSQPPEQIFMVDSEETTSLWSSFSHKPGERFLRKTVRSSNMLAPIYSSRTGRLSSYPNHLPYREAALPDINKRLHK